MKQILHVGRQTIASNARHGTNEPAIICRTYKGAERHHEVEFVTKDGTVVGKMVYRPHDPLPCGARLWIELDTDVCEARPIDVDANSDTSQSQA